jgi:hypothetical protein
VEPNRSKGRGQVVAIGALSAALAVLGVGCRDDGNDLVDGDDRADTIEASDASDASDASNGSEVPDASQASSIGDEPAGTAATDVTAAGTATSAPSDRPTDTSQPAQSAGTRPADAEDTPGSGTAPDATQPPASDPPPTTTQPATEPPPPTQPIDAGTLAFCDAVVAAEATFTRGPLVDFATATPEEIDAAVAEHEATLDSLLGATAAASPAGIAPDVATVVDFVRSSLASGEDVASDPDYRAADERVDVFVADSCGYRTVEVSAVEYSFDTIPTSLPAGRTTFVFTNNGAEIHEMVVFRINDGVTETVDELLALPEDEAFEKVTFTGATFGVQRETDTETFELTPGRYVALCFVPIGTTEVEPDDADVAEPGPPHFTEGMQAEFTVS